jgi:ribosome-associated protein
MKSLDKAMLAADIIMERKAVDPVLFNIGGMTSFADYFLIAGGNSTRQVQSIGRHLIEKMREHGFKAYGTEGENEGQWILMDYEPVRAFYDLEGLWMEAPRIEIKNNGPKKEKK